MACDMFFVPHFWEKIACFSHEGNRQNRPSAAIQSGVSLNPHALNLIQADLVPGAVVELGCASRFVASNAHGVF